MVKDPKASRLVILWDANGLKVQGNVANPAAIAMLEMAKAILMQQTVGPAKSYGPQEATLMQAPTIQARQVDRPAS